MDSVMNKGIESEKCYCRLLNVLSISFHTGQFATQGQGGYQSHVSVAYIVHFIVASLQWIALHEGNRCMWEGNSLNEEQRTSLFVYDILSTRIMHKA